MSPRAALRSESGLTLIEVMVAGLILVVGLIGTLSVMNGGKRSSTATQRTQAALAYGQSYIEELATTTWSQLGYTTANLPKSETDATPADPAPSTPAAYLSGCSGGAGTTCTGLTLHQAPASRTSPPPSGATSSEAFVTVSSGGISPKIALPGGAGSVYQYVTQASDLCVTVAGVQQCPAKRLTVAVVLAAGAGQNATKPVWLSTVVTDPGVQPL